MVTQQKQHAVETIQYLIKSVISTLAKTHLNSTYSACGKEHKMNAKLNRIRMLYSEKNKCSR